MSKNKRVHWTVDANGARKFINKPLMTSSSSSSRLRQAMADLDKKREAEALKQKKYIPKKTSVVAKPSRLSGKSRKLARSKVREVAMRKDELKALEKALKKDKK